MVPNRPSCPPRPSWSREHRPAGAVLYSAVSTDGQVAQLVEHVTENHGVGGSIPSLATSRNIQQQKDLGSSPNTGHWCRHAPLCTPGVSARQIQSASGRRRRTRRANVMVITGERNRCRLVVAIALAAAWWFAHERPPWGDETPFLHDARDELPKCGGQGQEVGEPRSTRQPSCQASRLWNDDDDLRRRFTLTVGVRRHQPHVVRARSNPIGQETR